jgi:hypothetical protein
VKPGWDDVGPRDWAEREAHRIAVEVRERRKPRSAQWLADRTAALGFPMSRALITDIELGRRRYVTTAELLILAAALETAPIMLLYPPPYSDDIEVLPGGVLRKFDAVQAFSGAVEPGVSSPEYAVNVHPLHRARQIVAAMRARDQYADAWDIEGDLPDEGEYKEALLRAQIRLEQLKANDGW